MKIYSRLLPISMIVISFFLMTRCSEYRENDPVEEEVVEEPMDTAAAVQEIDSLRNTFITMVKSGNYGPMESMSHPDLRMTGPNGPEWDRLRAISEETLYPVGAEMKITPTEITVINETWAFETGDTEIIYTPEDGGEPIVARDTYLVIFKNEGEGWKLYREVAAGTTEAE